ncbi:MAG: Lrp/AsnC family transcriptional regulator [archaeon]
MKLRYNMRYLQEKSADRKPKIDLKDKKILCQLAGNARLHATQIGKNVGLSRDVVSYRIKNLTDNGIIQGYRTVIDIKKMGYVPYHLFISLTKTTKDIEQKLIYRLSKFPFMRAVLKFAGKYDLELAFIARNMEDLDENLNTIIEACSKYLQDYELLSISRYHKLGAFPTSFYSDCHVPAQFEKKDYNGDFKQLIKDKKNIQILKTIADNGNLELYKIADKCKLSPDAVNYRMKKMIESGLITKFVPVINYSALSYNIYAILLNIQGLIKEKEKLLLNCLNEDNNILWAVKTVGKYNVLLYVCVKNADEVHNTLKNIRNTFSADIKSHETLIAYESYKYTYFPSYISI